MTDMTVSETLNKAADLIEERGWTTGDGWHHEDGGPLCLEGGILAAIGGSFNTGDHYRCPAYAAVRDYLRHQTSKAPWQWNDHLPMAWLHDADSPEYDPLGSWVGGSREAAYEYSRDQVIATLRAAAVIAESRETVAEPAVEVPC